VGCLVPSDVITIFVDHYSLMGFTFLQMSTRGADMVEAERAFHSKMHRVMVHHYHANNGIFTDAEFVNVVQADGQTISYCAVNAHHQNDEAKKKIRDLQEMARMLIQHAK
jgi:hypothetical protein